MSRFVNPTFFWDTLYIYIKLLTEHVTEFKILKIILFWKLHQVKWSDFFQKQGQLIFILVEISKIMLLQSQACFYYLHLVTQSALYSICYLLLLFFSTFQLILPCTYVGKHCMLILQLWNSLFLSQILFAHLLTYYWNLDTSLQFAIFVWYLEIRKGMSMSVRKIIWMPYIAFDSLIFYEQTSQSKIIFY